MARRLDHSPLPASIGVHDVQPAASLTAPRALREGDLRVRRSAEAGSRRERRGRVLRLRAPSQEGEERDPDERDEDRDCAAPTASPPPTLPRLLDQRLDKGVELLMGDGIAGARWSGWSGDGHDNLRSPIELVLLGP